MRKKRIYIAPETDSVHLNLKEPAMVTPHQDLNLWNAISDQTTQDGTDENDGLSTFGFFEEEETPVKYTNAWDDWKE